MRFSHTPAVTIASVAGGYLALVLLVAPAVAQSPLPPIDPARELALLMRSLDRTSRILYVTAHPDDEDAGLLARLTYGEGVEVALLTLTRGEGGQNEIGTELFHALGVLRSRELQAAARFTGVEQYFTRAYEFGYSFSVEETFDIWGEQAILRDVVRVVRSFRPDVILTLPHVGEGGGQHHQASAQLAARAFEIAATGAMPELGASHESARLFRHVWDEREHVEARCDLELGIYDPVLGASYEEFGAASRAAHKCQGMARYTDPLPSRLSRWECRFVRNGEVSGFVHVLDDLDEPLVEESGRETPFGAALRAAAREARDAHRIGGGEPLLQHLLALHDLVRDARVELRRDPGASVRLETLESRIGRAIQLASGLRLRARTPGRHVARGDTFEVRVDAQNTGGKPIAVEIAFAGEGAEQCVISRAPGSVETAGTGRWPAGNPEGALRLLPGAHASARYGFAVKSDAAATLPVPVPLPGEEIDEEEAVRFLRPRWSAFRLRAALRLAGREIALPERAVECQELDAAFPSIFYSDPHIVPDPSVRIQPEVVAAPHRGDGEVSAGVDVRVGSRRGGPVRVQIRVTEPWRADPVATVLDTRRGGAEAVLRVELRAPPGTEDPVIVDARASRLDGSGGASGEGFDVIAHRHVRPDALLRRAAVRVVPFACDVDRSRRVGTVRGAGDRVEEAFSALGVPVRVLESGDLLEADLDALDVIVTGVRAYKVREDLRTAHPRLMAWVERGGTLIVQYNKLEFNAEADESPYAPFPATRVGRRRVSVEGSPVVVNAPEHAVFNVPNPIGASDWEGWVQERGLYFLDGEDRRYEDLLTLEDPWPFNAGPKGGALVVAPLGDGHWVYVGLGLFRQLPAGVPGAYRLLANLISLGADAPDRSDR